MLKNYLKITWKILKRKKIYTTVTLAGICIPVIFIVLISSFLTGINNFESPRSRFRNVIYLNNLTWKEIKENGDVNMNMGNPPNYFFVKKYVKTLETPEKVATVSDNQFDEPSVIYLKNKPHQVVLKYTDPEFWELTDFIFLDGRGYNKTEFENRDNVVVIDEKTSKAIFGNVKTTGEYIEIESETYRIIGVIENADITMYRIASNIYLPLTCSEEYAINSIWTGWTNALILTENTSDFDKINNEFQQKLKYVTFDGDNPCNYIEGSLEKESYIIRAKNLLSNYLDINNVKDSTFLFVILLLIFFFILLPSINLVNINTNRIYERLSEIGARKTFGATRSGLAYQFIFENILVTLLGGALSILISFIIIKIFNFYDLLSGVILRLNIESLLISLLAILILSLLSGFMPSVKMAQSNIVESLNSTEKN